MVGKRRDRRFSYQLVKRLHQNTNRQGWLKDLLDVESKKHTRKRASRIYSQIGG